MKISELISEISFKINGADDLTKFDEQMKSIAASAREAVIALRQLARTQLPKQFIPDASAAKTAKRSMALVPIGATGGGGTNTVISSANIIIHSARVVIQGSVVSGGGPGGGGGGVVPSAGGGGMSFGQLAKIGLGAFGLVSIVGALRGFISTLKEMVQTSRAAAFATDKLTSSTGLSLKELKQWEYIATKGGLEPGMIQGTLQRLTVNREAMRWGQGNYTPFKMFGIDWTTDAGSQLRQFFANTSRDTQAQAEQKASMLGIDPSVVYLRNYLGEKAPDNFALTDKEQKATMALNAAWQDMLITTSSLASKITSDLAPALTDVIEIINKVERFFTGNPQARTAALGMVSPSNGPFIGAAIAPWLLPRISVPHTISAAGGGPEMTVNQTFNGVSDVNIPEKSAQALKNAFYQMPPVHADR